MSEDLRTYAVVISLKNIDARKSAGAAEVLQKAAHGKVRTFFSSPKAQHFGVFLQADCGADRIVRALYGAALGVQTAVLGDEDDAHVMHLAHDHAASSSSRSFSFLRDIVGREMMGRLRR